MRVRKKIGRGTLTVPTNTSLPEEFYLDAPRSTEEVFFAAVRGLEVWDIRNKGGGLAYVLVLKERAVLE